MTTAENPRPVVEGLPPVKVGPIATVILGVLAAYRRWISPMFGPHCRFHPSCSAYAVDAVTEHGAARGGWLALRRLAKCQPFFPGGHDPVPSRSAAPRRARLRGAPR